MRSMVFATLFSFATASAGFAFDINAMSDAERAAFRAEIREYLLENPEVLMEAIAVLEARQSAEAEMAEADMLIEFGEAIFNDGYSYVGGNPDGDITIVEFLDYRCGFCKRAFPAVEELIASDGNIRFIVKEFPILGEASVLGSRYAIAAKEVAGDEAYKAIHDEMMSLRSELTEAAIRRISSDLDLPHDEIAAQMDSEFVTNVIQTNRALAQQLQIQGTPSFIMGESFVRGFVELDQMREIVAQERANKG
ncbi:MAG: DsbA family protein [Boseongicola sp.]|nr:DsbA family protein [Boseongicola sp.]